MPGRGGRRLPLLLLVSSLFAAIGPTTAYHQIVQDEPESHISSLPIWHPAKRGKSGNKNEPEVMPDGYGTWETCDRCERCIVGPPPAVRCHSVAVLSHRFSGWARGGTSTVLLAPLPVKWLSPASPCALRVAPTMAATGVCARSVT